MAFCLALLKSCYGRSGTVQTPWHYSCAYLTDLVVQTTDVQLRKNSEATSAESKISLISEIVSEEDENRLLRLLRNKKPMLPVHSYSLTPFINHSQTLKSLLALGVDLTKLEKTQKAAELVVKMDFHRDIDPYLLFLRTSGVPDDCLGQVINRFPLLFSEDLSLMQARLTFLQSYGFSLPNIGRIISSVPAVLQLNVQEVDKKLEAIKKEFSLDQQLVVSVITKCPRMLTFDNDKLKFNKLCLKEMAGFSETELKTMLLSSPRIFTGSKQHMLGVYDYLHHVMDIKMSQIVAYPQIFRSRLRRIEYRHQFLVSLSRNQYDPKLPNYVSLFTLVSGSDQEFVENIAKSTIEKFNLFLKTL